MSGERFYARERERARTAGLRERREFERERVLDAQDAALAALADNRAGTGRNMFRRCACGAHAGSLGMCNDCYRELGGES